MPKDSIVRVVHRKRHKRVALIWKATVVLALTTFSLIVCYPKYRQVELLVDKCERLEAEIAEKDKLNRGLIQRKERLVQDPEAMEEIARALLEVHRPGERVYRLVEDDQPHDKGKGGENN